MTGAVIRYAITDRLRFAGDERDQERALLAQVRHLHAAGVDYLQLREKDLAPEALLGLARQLRRAVPIGGPPRLLLNGSPTLALRAAFDGVHLPGGWTSATIRAARGVLSEGSRPSWISVAAHSGEDVRAATEVDMILFGPVFGKQVHGEAVAGGTGLPALAATCHAAGPVPVFALGGVTAENTPLCLAAGAAGVAGIRLFACPQGRESTGPRRPGVRK